MLDATGHDQELALLQPNVPVPELHAEAALDHEEKLVLVVVMVPDERTPELDQFDLLTVQFAHDPGLPLLGEPGELLPEVDLLHAWHSCLRVDLPQCLG